MNKTPLFALLAATLFGLSTPLAKLLVGEINPWLLAGLLYIGSSLGLVVILTIRGLFFEPVKLLLPRREWLWLSLATLFGGILGPVFLMKGLSLSTASSSSLLLNLEGVFTALLAWFAFREHFNWRNVMGMIFILTGGVLLAFPSLKMGETNWHGQAFVVFACLSWGLDNNFTRKISASDSTVLTFYKSLVASLINVVIAYNFLDSFPELSKIGFAMTLGFFGYGLSIVFFVLSLRNMGTARTSAYFSTAPFIGAITSILIFKDEPNLMFLGSGLLMAIGVWLHITENHAHEHTHGDLEHSHRHFHDEHHRHKHDTKDPVGEPHTHWHAHAPLNHTHQHLPDIHHRHSH